MPYLDVFVDDDQFDLIVVEELDYAISNDPEIENDSELRRAMMLVRNYFSDQSEIVQQAFPFMHDYQEMENELSSKLN